MSRRSTPERIDQAREAATRSRLIGEGVTPDTADAWIAAWAEQAARDGIERGAVYWTPDVRGLRNSSRSASGLTRHAHAKLAPC